MKALVLKWLLFSGCVSLLPFLYPCVALMNHEKFTRFGVVWERGEFLLVSITILITSLGDLVACDNHRLLKTKLFVIGCCILIVLGLCAWYGSIVESLVTGQTYAVNAVTFYSPIAFGVSIAGSLACVMLSHKPEVPKWKQHS